MKPSELAGLIDRGWDQLEDGDPEGAERTAERALKIDRASGEALTLLGAIRVNQGREEEALEKYQEAMAAAPGFAPARLYAAELLLGWDKDHTLALALIDEAIQKAADEVERLDAMLLKAEALITFGDRDQAALAALQKLPRPPLPAPELSLRAGKAFLDLARLEQAEQHFKDALKIDAEIADAYYGLGLIHEARGDRPAMIAAFKNVREIDVDEPPEPWSLDREEFVALAERAIAELPPPIHQRISNIPIMAEELPDLEVIEDGFDPRMLGFFAGVPFPEQASVGGPGGNLEHILLYQRNIERACSSEEEVIEEIKITVLHETAHFFGLSDDDLDEIGLG